MAKNTLILTTKASLETALADARSLRDAADRLAKRLETQIAQGYEMTKALPEQTDAEQADDHLRGGIELVHSLQEAVLAQLS